jgi:carbon-monoxide dehydrogenase large subunit
MQKFSIGQPVRRREDQRFITGAGCYLDDIQMPGMTHAAFVRSPHAHARIVAIDTTEAKAAPGVLAVFTHEDVAAAGLGTFPTLDQVDGVDDNGISVPPRHALTGGVVRFVGDPVSMVVAETDEQARRAADLVMVDYDDLPAAVDVATVLDASTPLVWPQFGTNRVYHFHKGDLEGTDQALKAAHHVVSLDFINNRLAPCAVEPRGVIGSWNAPEEQYVLHVSGQAVFGQRAQMADRIFKVPAAQIRVIMPDVGGGFGAKNFV